MQPYHIFDIIIIVIFIIFIIISIKKGFFVRIIDFLGIIFSLVISFFLNKPLRNSVFKTLGNLTNDFLYNKLIDSNEVFTAELTIENQKEMILKGLNEIHIPNFIGKLFLNKLTLQNVENKNIADIISPFLGNIIMCVVVFIITFLVIFLLTKLLKLIVKKCSDIKPFNIIDKILAGILGLIQSALVIYIFLIILYGLKSSNYFSFTHNFIDSITNFNNNYKSLGGFMYKYNIFILIYNYYIKK